MNCKQGDLAIIVGPVYNDENLGKLVTCVQHIPHMQLMHPDGIDRREYDMWEIDPPIRSWRGTMVTHAADRALKPIRYPGEDAKDEMLRPLPVESKSNERS